MGLMGKISGGSRVPTLISFGDNHADRLLIKSLVTALALQVFQMAANRAVPAKRFGLRRGNQPGLTQALNPDRIHWPALTFGKGLLEKRKIRKRFHGANPGLGKLLPQAGEI